MINTPLYKPYENFCHLHKDRKQIFHCSCDKFLCDKCLTNDCHFHTDMKLTGTNFQKSYFFEQVEFIVKKNNYLKSVYNHQINLLTQVLSQRLKIFFSGLINMDIVNLNILILKKCEDFQKNVIDSNDCYKNSYNPDQLENNLKINYNMINLQEKINMIPFNFKENFNFIINDIIDIFNNYFFGKNKENINLNLNNEILNNENLINEKNQEISKNIFQKENEFSYPIENNLKNIEPKFNFEINENLYFSPKRKFSKPQNNNDNNEFKVNKNLDEKILDDFINLSSKKLNSEIINIKELKSKINLNFDRDEEFTNKVKSAEIQNKKISSLEKNKEIIIEKNIKEVSDINHNTECSLKKNHDYQNKQNLFEINKNLLLNKFKNNSEIKKNFIEENFTNFLKNNEETSTKYKKYCKFSTYNIESKENPIEDYKISLEEKIIPNLNSKCNDFTEKKLRVYEKSKIKYSPKRSLDSYQSSISNSSFKTFIKPIIYNIKKFEDISTKNILKNKFLEKTMKGNFFQNINETFKKKSAEKFESRKNRKDKHLKKKNDSDNFYKINLHSNKKKSSKSNSLKNNSSSDSKKIIFFDDNSQEKDKTINDIQNYKKILNKRENSFNSSVSVYNSENIFENSDFSDCIDEKTNLENAEMNKKKIMQILEGKKMEKDNGKKKTDYKKERKFYNNFQKNDGLCKDKKIFKNQIKNEECKFNFKSMHHHYKCSFYNETITLIDANCLCLKKLNDKMYNPKNLNFNKKVDLYCEDCRALFTTDKDKAHYRKKCYNCFVDFKLKINS